MPTIKNPGADELPGGLAAGTGQSITTAVTHASQKPLPGADGRTHTPNLAADLMKTGRRCAAYPEPRSSRRRPDSGGQRARCMVIGRLSARVRLHSVGSTLEASVTPGSGKVLIQSGKGRHSASPNFRYYYSAGLMKASGARLCSDTPIVKELVSLPKYLHNVV